MYTPRPNLVEDEAQIRAMVAAARSGWFVTNGADGVPQATLLPIVWTGEVVVMHLARANRQWRGLHDGAPALLIVPGPEAYISPSWYEQKRIDGRVVPTWNYSAVQLVGTVRVIHDVEWLRRAVDELVEFHESGREAPWALADAPEDYVDVELSGIVGIEFAVTGVTAKAKLSQNRSGADRRGAIEGLRRDPHPADAIVADQMQEQLDR